MPVLATTDCQHELDGRARCERGKDCEYEVLRIDLRLAGADLLVLTPGLQYRNTRRGRGQHGFHVVDLVRAQRIGYVVPKRDLQLHRVARIDEPVAAAFVHCHARDVQRRRSAAAFVFIPAMFIFTICIFAIVVFAARFVQSIEHDVGHGETRGRRLSVGEARRRPRRQRIDEEGIAVLGHDLVVVAQIRLAGVVAPAGVERAVRERLRRAPSPAAIIGEDVRDFREIAGRTDALIVVKHVNPAGR